MKSSLIAFFLILTSAASGQVRKYANSFLNIGVDARAFAMGQAVVAQVSDVSAAYWNPAGLARITSDWDAALMHAEYFASIAQYDYASVATQLEGKGVLAVTFLRFGVDDIPNTSELIDENGNVDYNRIQLFSAADQALLISYARSSASVEGLTYGGSAKLVYRYIGDFADAYGFGFDLGLQYQRGRWAVGAMMRDATSTFTAWSVESGAFDEVFLQTGNELPQNNVEWSLPRLIMGGSGIWELDERYSLRTSLDAEFTFDGRRNTLISSDFGNVDPRLGAELDYKGFAFFRMGVGNINRTLDVNGDRSYSWQPNLGIGFRYQGVQLDYALTDIGDRSAALYSNLFSLRYNWSRQ